VEVEKHWPSKLRIFVSQHVYFDRPLISVTYIIIIFTIRERRRRKRKIITSPSSVNGPKRDRLGGGGHKVDIPGHDRTLPPAIICSINGRQVAMLHPTHLFSLATRSATQKREGMGASLTVPPSLPSFCFCSCCPRRPAKAVELCLRKGVSGPTVWFTLVEKWVLANQ